MFRPLFCIIPHPGNWEHNMEYLHDNYLMLGRITLQNSRLASSNARCNLLFLRNFYHNSILLCSPSLEGIINNLRPSIMESFEEPRVIICAQCTPCKQQIWAIAFFGVHASLKFNIPILPRLPLREKTYTPAWGVMLRHDRTEGWLEMIGAVSSDP